MAHEITHSAMAIAYTNADGRASRHSVAAFKSSLVENSPGHAIENTAKVGTTEQAISKGNITTPGWFQLSNRMPVPTDEDDYVITVRASSGGTAIAECRPGETIKMRFPSGVTAPYLISSTAGTVVDYLLVEK